ncbi:hypothetical protein D3C78_1773630 [compost metagenome]
MGIGTHDTNDETFLVFDVQLVTDLTILNTSTAVNQHLFIGGNNAILYYDHRHLLDSLE